MDGGWSWKFDGKMMIFDQLVMDLYRPVACPVALVRNEHGLVPPLQAEEMAGRIRENVSVIEIPAAGHHVMVDEPLALVAALRTLLAVWA